MIIQSNLPAINSHRNLLINNQNVARNLERLSSGFRVNRAGDDAAGLAISERMRGQIRGLAMAEQNTANGISLIQTAEGGLNETHAILQRMRELAVQASNGTFQGIDREQIHLEMVALIDEIDRISASTHYNNINLLDGSFGSINYNEFSAANGDTVLGIDTSGDFGWHNLRVMYDFISHANAYDGGANPTHMGQTGELYNALDLNARIIVTRVDGGDLSAALQVGDRTFVGRFFESSVGYFLELRFLDNDGHMAAIATLADAGFNWNILDQIEEGVISNITFNPSASSTHVGGGGRVRGYVLEDAFDQARVVARGSQDNVLTFQVGANGGLDQRTNLSVFNMSSAALGVTDVNGRTWTVRDIANSTHVNSFNPDFAGNILHERAYSVRGRVSEALPGVSILTRNGANAAIAVLDAAINQVSDQRAQLGAMQNRLEHTMNSLGVARENLTAAESTIRDVDMAAEMMRFTQNNILVQASQAMLAQANQLPQGVLSLLR